MMPQQDQYQSPALKAALFYHSLGWSVVPVHTSIKVDGKVTCSCNKGPHCTSPGKHPAVAWAKYQKERASEIEIRAWFSGPFKASGVGIITGKVSGIFVVDVDSGPGKSGSDTMHDLQMTHDDLPETCEAITGSGGQHLIYRAPEGVNIVTDKGVLGPDVDTRGEGGFVVASPSFHACGNRYRWKAENHPQTMAVADAPDWVINMAREDHWHKRHHDGVHSSPGVITRAPLTNKVTDGRETHMCRIILAALITYTGENGCFPDPDELFDACWHSYEQTTDFSRPGRGADEFRHKCVTTIRRAEAGTIHSLPDLEAFVLSAEAKKNSADDTPPTQEEMQAEANIIASGAAEYPLPLIWYDAIEPNLEANDFVEELLEDGAMSVVYGESNCGKTFWASDLSMHIAAGIKWRDHATEQGAVIYVALEGGNGIKNRVAAFKQHHGIKSMPFAVIPSSVNMLDPNADTPKLITTILAVAKQLEGTGIPVRMVVIDTLSRALAGGNENASEDMGAVVNSADRVRQATGAHLMFIHHSGKNAAAGARGHSLLRAATDSEIEVTHDQDSPVSVATVTKQREMEGGHQFIFSLKTVVLGTNRRGKEVRSCVVTEATKEETAVVKMPQLTTQEVRALSGVKNALATDGYNALVAGSHTKNVVTVEILKREWASLGVVERDKGDTQRQQFKRMKDSLVNKGYIDFWNDTIWLSVTGVTDRDNENCHAP